MQGIRFDNKVNKVSAKSLSCSSENALNCESSDTPLQPNIFHSKSVHTTPMCLFGFNFILLHFY